MVKKKNKTARQKKKSCRPPKDGMIIDAASSYKNSLTFSMSGVSKEKWEKIFGSKDNKKRTNKKT